MKILFVEDNDGFASDLTPAILDIEHVKDLCRVSNKEEALACLSTDLFDLIILDLSIPASADITTPTPEHGQAVFHEARAIHPGTPIFILTGSEADKFSRTLAKYGDQVRLWGSSTAFETVSYFLKEEVDELVERVKVLAADFSKMNSVAINTRGRDLGLSLVQEKMLKSYANSIDCIACDVSLLSGGLSDAKVVKAAAIDLSRKRQALCAGKLGDKDTISAEMEAYERHVRKLGIGACPTMFAIINNGVGANGAIFYTLTDDDTLSLFERLKTDPAIGPTVVSHVRAALLRWSEAATATLITVGEIRQRLIGDDDADIRAVEFDLHDLRSVESMKVQAAVSCVHGDLHCGNVLVKSTGEAVLIDFGDAGQGFTALDPIALELSLIFHPDSKKAGLRDNLIGRLEHWPDVDAFADDDPLKPTILACREWAHDVGGGDHAVLAAAYAYAFRQLKYKTVDPAVTAKFLAKIVSRLRSS